ncbi:BZ3501_MvSof-1269-A2-R1_Chr5-1g07282 [Microbotryum saponariae]|nr:BZ3501_MvSof-1269-A2-R1_Chr5-1g07282 [Microbotryum saponariae]
MIESLTVLTFNVRSMKNAVNQVKIIRYLKTLRPAPAAILLQEHHLSYNASREGFESAWPGACIRAPRFDGRILRSVFRLEELDVEIINMYAPVQEDDRRDFFGLLHFNAPRPKTLRILAGDLNDCPDVSVDESKDLLVVADRLYSVQCSWANRLLSASTLFDAPCSDHRPVVATFACLHRTLMPTPLSLPSTSDFISRLNPMVFDDQDFVASIPGVVDGRWPCTIPLDSCRHAPTAGREPIRHGGFGARGEHMNEAERDAYAHAKSRLDQLAVKEAQWLRIRAHCRQSTRGKVNRQAFARASTPESQTSIVSLEDVDGTETVDMQEALARGDPTNARRSLLDPIRAAKCYDDDRSDPTFGRRLPRQARVALDEPFTLLEVEAALKKTDSGRSPGPSGIPYELFKALPTYFAPKLLDLFNSIWEGGKMTAKVLVARLNGVLGELLPPAQHGFMPSRRSADAGSHLTLLLEKLNAYDRVDHAWIFEVFEAFGFGERFISLLRALYDPETLGVRYLVNGFPTDLVRLLCGLGQGDPLSCPVWNITFQPFLDALLTHLAFADDAVVVVESPAALSKLQTLSQTWYEATNGKTNTDKTLVLPLGPNWLRDETAQALPTVQEGESFKWCGLCLLSPR